jgi:hypothetical protein
MPITRSTSGARSSAEMNDLPISPVGPVTATVNMRSILPKLRQETPPPRMDVYFGLQSWRD